LILFKKWNLTEWVVLPILTKKIHMPTYWKMCPDTVKQDRANEIMELQSQISWDLNQEKVGTNI
jgi:tRNA A37 methylthiotransferase MiaB